VRAATVSLRAAFAKEEDMLRTRLLANRALAGAIPHAKKGVC